MIRSAHRDAHAYETRDGSLIRELMHPALHGNRAQSLAEATIRAGQTTRRHRHSRTEEIYYILEGQGRMTVDEEAQPACAGDAILIPPGAWHRITNTGPDDLVLLCCCSPAYAHADTELAARPAADQNP